VAARARGYTRGAGASRDVVQGEEAFAAAGMLGTQGQVAQVCQRLAPTLMLNS
jgi:hypothetical protein